MKYLIFSILLLIILFGFCIWTGSVVENTIEQTEKLLTQAVTEIQNNNTIHAHELITQAASQWENDQRLLGILLEHDETSEVQCAFVELLGVEPAAYTLDVDHTCEALLRKIRHIKEQDKAKLENIL